MTSPRLTALLLAVTVCGLVFAALDLDPTITAAPARAADDKQTRGDDSEVDIPSALVVIDGIPLFRVRGTSVLPAGNRGAAIALRLKALAADRAVPVEALRSVETNIGSAIVAGDHRVMTVFDADARYESLDRNVLTEALVGTIRAAVTGYRQARSRDALIRTAVYSSVATAILAALVAFVVWLSRRAQTALEATYRQRVQSVGIQSFQIVRAEQIWVALRRALIGVRAVVILGLAFVCVQYVLGLLPWTRGASNQLAQYLLDPLATMGRGVVGAIPDVIFLVILFFLTRYLLKVINLFFAAVGRGEVVLVGFEREWADPTYKLLRVAIVALALVVAYPYIPGSSSDAFKGISIFIGIVFSLGSSSTIANVIAGYTMTYRRAFHIGDRVKIGNITGDVTEMRLQVTHLRTIKNEEVIIPNSSILNNEVVNYSSLAHRHGLILHTTVGIGYETPWRQVEAMLVIAAERTPGIMSDPKPFVRQLSLGDFAVTYEINVYCDDPHTMAQIYTALHRNILDVFNEHGIQIMTPAYEGDPESPKVVPKEQWFTAPAKTIAEPEGRGRP